MSPTLLPTGLSRIDRIALLISMAACVAAIFVSQRIYERMPHIEDEMAFTWQARAIERGRIWVPSPQPNPNSLLTPFVIDYQGRRFGKYPLGWPALLALAEIAHVRDLLNPLLTGLSVWLMYRLVKKITGEPTALLAAGLMASSPFVLINAGSLLSHPWSLLLTIVFCIAWLDAFDRPNPALPARAAGWLPVLTAGLAFGNLLLTRPWTAVGVALPFVVHGIILLVRGSRSTRLRLASFGLLVLAIACLHLLWQYEVTGSPWVNPYTLWWPYDSVGFGPGHGPRPEGHQPLQAWIHTRFSLVVGSADLFGWPFLSWLFLPFGLLALRRSRAAWLVSALLITLVGAYALYWTPSWVYGPRYYYEALPAPLLLTAAGITWLARQRPSERLVQRWRFRLRFAAVSFVIILLVAANLAFYLPMRVSGMYGLYGISSRCLSPFRSEMARTAIPALVFVHLQERYMEYGCLLDLNSPFLDSEYLVVISRGPEIDRKVIAACPQRTVLHYYADSPHLFEYLRDSPQQ